MLKSILFIALLAIPTAFNCNAENNLPINYFQFIGSYNSYKKSIVLTPLSIFRLF